MNRGALRAGGPPRERFADPVAIAACARAALVIEGPDSCVLSSNGVVGRHASACCHPRSLLFWFSWLVASVEAWLLPAGPHRHWLGRSGPRLRALARCALSIRAGRGDDDATS